MRVTFTPAREDLLRCELCKFFQRPWLVTLAAIPCLIGGAVLSRMTNIEPVLSVCLCVVALALFLLFIAGLASNDWRDKQDYVVTLLAPDGIHRSLHRTMPITSHVEWSRVGRVSLRNGDIYIQVNGVEIWYVPRSAFPDLSHAQSFYEAAVAAKSGNFSPLKASCLPDTQGNGRDIPGWDPIPAGFEPAAPHQLAHTAPRPVYAPPPYPPPHPIPAAPVHQRPPILTHNAPPGESWSPGTKRTRLLSWDVVERNGRLTLSKRKSDAANEVVGYMFMYLFLLTVAVGGVWFAFAIPSHRNWIDWSASILGALVVLGLIGHLLWGVSFDCTMSDCLQVLLRGRTMEFDRDSQEILVDGHRKCHFSDVTVIELARVDDDSRDRHGRRSCGILSLQITFASRVGIIIDSVQLDHTDQLRPFAEYLARHIGHELVLTPLKAPYPYTDP
ncbi:MAG: hypothetical protein ACLQVD_03065 [Capsulimonadaceae bacterium]